jgi:AcrR family transcriptional regulator
MTVLLQPADSSGARPAVKNDRSFYDDGMPRVSDAHLSARRDQIIDAATLRFAANGFQATGMADIIAASGLSAGAVYRYFRSKDELVEANVERVLGRAADRFEQLLGGGAGPRPGRGRRRGRRPDRDHRRGGAGRHDPGRRPGVGGGPP